MQITLISAHRSLVEQKIGVCLNYYTFWLQDAQEVSLSAA